MRYNKNIANFDKCMEYLNRESLIQDRLLRKIEATKNKIKATRIDLRTSATDEQKKRYQKLINWYEEDIINISKEIEQSKTR